MKNIIIACIILACFSSLYLSKKDFKDVLLENKSLKDSISLKEKEIKNIEAAFEANKIIIDSLLKERSKLHIEYRTNYEKYRIKDSLVSSYTVDSIQQFWAKRYNTSY